MCVSVDCSRIRHHGGLGTRSDFSCRTFATSTRAFVYEDLCTQEKHKVVCVLCFFGIFLFETIAFVIDLN